MEGRSMGQRVGSCTCRSQACLRDKHTLQGRRKTTADLHIISARCPSNWLIFVPDILLKWSFECFHAPSILFVCTSTSWRVFALIYVFLKVYLCVTVHTLCHWESNKMTIHRCKWCYHLPHVFVLLEGVYPLSDLQLDTISLSTIPIIHIWMNFFLQY